MPDDFTDMTRKPAGGIDVETQRLHEQQYNYELQQELARHYRRIAQTHSRKEPFRALQQEMGQRRDSHPLLNTQQHAGQHSPENPLITINDEARQKVDNELRHKKSLQLQNQQKNQPGAGAPKQSLF